MSDSGAADAQLLGANTTRRRIPRGEQALTLVDVTKRFGASLALDRASLGVRAGTIHALLGENGAGKTTLMRIAFGLIRADAGEVRLGDRPVTLRSPADAIAAGVGMVHQHYTTVPAMSVLENIELGGRGRLDVRQAAARVRALAAQVGLDVDPDARVGDLSVSAQQRVEIVKAIARDATILILDEPTAVLAPAEAEDLLRWLRRFADEGGAVVLITHKLTEAVAWADDVTVLRNGRTVSSAPRGEMTIEGIATAMLGEPPAQDAPLAHRAEGSPRQRDGQPPSGVASAPRHPLVARAERVEIRSPGGGIRIRDASFDLRGGEIVGVAGVDGAGQSELLRALGGRLTISAGSLTLPEQIAFVPGDRHRDALLMDFSLAENVALRGAGARRGRLPWKDVERHTTALLREFDVRGGDPRTRASLLSGGNQQKLVLTRELNGAPALLVAENPTRGLDIRAAAAVHDRLRAARDAGTAVVVYSSDLDEVIGLASRVLVVHQGAVSEWAPDRASVGAAMLGVAMQGLPQQTELH